MALWSLLPFPGILPDGVVRKGNVNGQDAEGSQEEAVPHVGHDIHGVHGYPALGSQGGSGKELGAVGDDALEDAGKDIQKRG